MNVVEVDLPEKIGKGYGKFWNFKGRYRVVKGSRASKKSKTIAQWFIVNIMKYPSANALVVRKVFRTLKDSCFTDLEWAVNNLHVAHLWEFKKNPMEVTYLPTGQKILFRGMDDALKITSISVKKGSLCWVWVEECYEITNEDAFDMLNESIRGVVEPPLFKQITISFNPWNQNHWLKKRFFDVKDEDILAITTNYMINEWLDENDSKMFEHMKKYSPKRYQVAGLGEWGISDGLIYENWEEKEFDYKEILQKNKDIKAVFGLDFGYTNDETAFFCGLIDENKKIIYVFEEIYKTRMQNTQIYKEIVELGFKKERIIADCAEPKSIDQLKGLGLERIKGCVKGKDSINNGIQFIQDFKIIVHPQCTNFITEISNYCWDKDRLGNTINKPVDEFNHLMDAMRYALQEYVNKSLKGINLDRKIISI